MLTVSSLKSQSRLKKSFGLVAGTLITGLIVSLSYASSSQAPAIPVPASGTLQTDPEIQAIADQAIRDAVVREKARMGYALVAEAKTGRVLAVANFDQSGTRNPSSHWALSEPIEPASALKGLIAARALELGKTTLDEKLNCENGSYPFGERIYHDHKKFDHQTTLETIVFSSNICGIKLGEKLGAHGLLRMLTDFGFGQGGVTQGFPEAQEGVVPAIDDGSRAQYVPQVSTGYGFYVTPLEMLQAYGAIANGGELMQPHPATVAQTNVVRRVLSPETSRQMRQVLREVVERGTAAAGLKPKRYSMAGKTATSYHPNEPDHRRLGGVSRQATFVGFAPAENPALVIYVAIDGATYMKWSAGGRDAAPVFGEIAEKALARMGVSPDLRP